MKRRTYFLLIIWLLKYNPAVSQAEGGVEQYYYPDDENHNHDNIIFIQGPKKWYAEARYNFQDVQTFSLYLGKTFSGGSTMSYSFTPMVGGVRGKFNGVSTGLKIDMEYEDLSFSSQSQYSFSTDRNSDNYFYNWSELNYQATPRLYAGLSFQHTRLYQTKQQFEPGLVVGFSFRQFSMPFYCFRPGTTDTYFILGFNFEWKYIRQGRESSVVNRE